MDDNTWAAKGLRLLQEICGYHGEYVPAVYALDRPGGGRIWVCQSCWPRLWIADGRPPQAGDA